MAKSRWSSQG